LANSKFLNTIMDDPKNRHPEDFYPTPPAGTLALLGVEKFRGKIWEPACGDGRMSRVLEESGLSMMSSDLYDRGYGESGVDFLTTRRKVANVITNPPFKLAQAFAEHALSLTSKKVALLCRLAWLEGRKRHVLFTTTPLARVWVFSARMAMLRNGDAMLAGGGGMIAFAWYVWEHGHQGPPALGWIAPKDIVI
jgi:hypothetical protein